MEDLKKRREPLPGMEAVYLMVPTLDNVKLLCQDFDGKEPRYRTAHVFFTSAPAEAALEKIRGCKKLVARLRELKDVNLEFEVVDGRTFVTGNSEALGLLYGEGTDEGTPSADREIKSIARRLATACLTLGEFPYVRFRSPQGSGLSGMRAHVPARIASGVHEFLTKAATKVDGLPAQGSSDLIVLDRGIDPVAAVIHEWTYEAMCHDLLDMRNNVYRYRVETNAGEEEDKEVILGESDPLWQELRHLHIADASLRLNEKMAKFSGTNKAAMARRNGGEGSIETKDLKGLVQSLPEYRDQLSKLALHIEIATALNERVRRDKLDEIGSLEQDIVHGDANSKDIVSLVQGMPGMSSLDKLRLLMCYVSTHQERLDDARKEFWSRAMKVSEEEMGTLQSLECLGIAVSKRESSERAKFTLRKPKKGIRKEKTGAESETSWQLFRFVPILSDIIEDAEKDALPAEEYPYVQAPTGLGTGSRAESSRTYGALGASSARSVRSTWTKRSASSVDDILEPEGSGVFQSEQANQKRRLIIFVVGGVTFSEMRLAHRLSAALGRDVILGSTSTETPSSFVQHVRSLVDPHACMEH